MSCDNCRFRSNLTDVTVIRSVSDAVEPSSKYSSMRRSNGYLRRPEVLETVYSVEETDLDGEESGTLGENKDGTKGKGKLQELSGSFERLANEAQSLPAERPKDESQQAQVRCVM